VSLDELKAAQNWQAQYRLITQWARLIQPKASIRNDNNLLRGCEVSAWLMGENCNGRNRFAFDSDSRVINGLVAALLSQVDNKVASELDIDSFKNLIADVGLEKHLTPSRNNGLSAVISRVQELVIV
jgi:cysteine desulfuration protein SufE